MTLLDIELTTTTNILPTNNKVVKNMLSIESSLKQRSQKTSDTIYPKSRLSKL